MEKNKKQKGRNIEKSDCILCSSVSLLVRDFQVDARLQNVHNMQLSLKST
jgi:hypothetical protein